ncbi:hypothetical protein GGR50DRAFT_558305 [Xylaria sp. CBS 124048]|nr:hypothetical protein GGR50DRAFT_558305 [Xylaria sp. CBS 124048]
MLCVCVCVCMCVYYTKMTGAASISSPVEFRLYLSVPSVSSVSSISSICVLWSHGVYLPVFTPSTHLYSRLLARRCAWMIRAGGFWLRVVLKQVDARDHALNESSRACVGTCKRNSSITWEPTSTPLVSRLSTRIDPEGVGYKYTGVTTSGHMCLHSDAYNCRVSR